MNNIFYVNNEVYSLLLPDHLLVLSFAICYPLFGYFSYRKHQHRIVSGELQRSSQYLSTAACQWTLAALALVLWWGTQRDWSVLGLGLAIGPRWYLACALVLLIVWYFLSLNNKVRRGDERYIAQLASALDALQALMPQSTRDLRAFYVLSFTAGVVEELLFRGYLIWYLVHYLPLWAAVLLAAILFGVAHAYQGIKEIPKFSLVGLVFCGLYVLSGSLWLPMLAHVAMDVIQGRMAFEYSRYRSRQPDL